MVDRSFFLKELKSSLEFLERATRALEEEDSTFSPHAESLTAAQQFAHIASTIHWFLDGAFSTFDLNFDDHMQEVRQVTSLEAARELVRGAYRRLFTELSERTDTEWTAQIAPGPIMGGEPRVSILFGILEHTAHHRGALSVYLRLLGKTPLMPYMEL